MTDDAPFGSLGRRRLFLSLTTFRRSGEAVATPLWFARHGDGVVVITLGPAGKVKRIRNNPAVTVAPCTGQGRVTGPSVQGTASILGGDDRRRAGAALGRRYLIGRRLIELEMRRRGRGAEPTYIKVDPGAR